MGCMRGGSIFYRRAAAPTVGARLRRPDTRRAPLHPRWARAPEGRRASKPWRALLRCPPLAHADALLGPPSLLRVRSRLAAAASRAHPSTHPAWPSSFVPVCTLSWPTQRRWIAAGECDCQREGIFGAVARVTVLEASVGKSGRAFYGGAQNNVTVLRWSASYRTPLA